MSSQDAVGITALNGKRDALTQPLSQAWFSLDDADAATEFLHQGPAFLPSRSGRLHGHRNKVHATANIRIFGLFTSFSSRCSSARRDATCLNVRLRKSVRASCVPSQATTPRPRHGCHAIWPLASLGVAETLRLACGQDPCTCEAAQQLVVYLVVS